VKLGVHNSSVQIESKLAGERAQKLRRFNECTATQSKRQELERRWYRRDDRDATTAISSSARGLTAARDAKGIISDDAQVRAAKRAARRTKSLKDTGSKRREHERNNRWYLKNTDRDTDVEVLRVKAKEHAKHASQLLQKTKEDANVMQKKLQNGYLNMYTCRCT
jgi:hypothetical protein